MKKVLIILSTLLLFSCKKDSSKQNSSDNNNQKTPVNEDIKPIYPDEIYSPFTRPEIKPASKTDFDVVKYIGSGKKYTLKEIRYSDYSTILDHNNKSLDVVYDNIAGDFAIKINRIDINKLSVIYTGVANLTSSNGKNSKIDCSGGAEYEFIFHDGSFSPYKINTIKENCTIEGLVYFPKVHAGVYWLYDNHFFKKIGVSTNENDIYNRIDSIAFFTEN